MRAPTMSSSSSKNQTISCSDDDAELRRGPWTLEEDTLLVHYIARHGEGRWNLLAKRAGLRRTGKSCRLRWLNYLKPDVKRGNLTPQEQFLILDLHSKWGNRWSKIAQHLPGRTDNEIKNYWRTRVQKQARHLKVDANSSTFQEIIKCFWMPRLLQKIEGSTTAAAATTSSSDPVLPISDNHPLCFNQNSTALPSPIPLPPPQQILHGHDQNSDSEHGTSTSCISSSESINVSQMSQLSEYPTTTSLPSLGEYNALIRTYVDGYDMDAINSFANISESGGFGIPDGNGQVAESDWSRYELLDATWNMDELWQFRNFQEREALQ